jgi:30S ribosomal protein 3
MGNSKKVPQYLFKVLWSKTYVGIGINEIYKEKFNLPLTTFYFWPREDGWKLLKSELDNKPWMEEEVRLEILNGYTSIIKYWLKNVNKKIKTQNFVSQNLNVNVEILGINTTS